MLIRYGYEIAVNCAQPTAMVCLRPIGNRGPLAGGLLPHTELALRQSSQHG
jgi:hypothetical protein